MSDSRREHDKAAELVGSAGGKVVGRTRLQKLAYLLEITGYGQGFHFFYKHYGPYSEQLTQATRSATALGLVNEIEQPTAWGGLYSTFTARPRQVNDAVREQFTSLVNQADAVELELAATAAFLKLEGEVDPWAETARRKPDKAAKGRLEKSKLLYERLRAVETKTRLPAIEN